MTVLALAGRRIDAPDADRPALPLANVARLRGQLATLMVAEGAERLICSAANGTDLIGLEVAMAQAVPFTIVLPFAPVAFRRSSVKDRPGAWGEVYDRALATADRLIVLPHGHGEDHAYDATTKRIIAEATAQSGKAVAILA